MTLRLWDPLQYLTNEREGCRQREEHAVAVHGEGDDKVHGQTSQQEEGVDCRPVGHIQPQLRTQTHKKKNTIKHQTNPDKTQTLVVA